MKLRHELVLLFLTIFNEKCIHASGLVQYVWEEPADLKSFCPYTSFCDKNASVIFPYSAPKTPCCRSCSCDPSCWKQGDCCLWNNGVREKEDPKTVCRSSVAVSESPKYHSLRHYTGYFKMVDKCSAYSQINCEELSSDLIESFHPMFSPSTGFIYINFNCCICNSVTDAVPWLKAVMCPAGNEGLLSDYISLILNGNYSYEYSECFLVYVPPPDLDLTTSRCEPEIIRKCNVSRIMISKKPFWDLCDAFNATFTYQSGVISLSYGNVYCFLCNYRFFENVNEGICIDDFINGVFRSFKLPLPLTAIIDDSSLTQRRNEKPQAIYQQCPVNSIMLRSFESTCRPIVCPSGQVRVNGTCSYHSKLWTGSKFSVLLKLTPFGLYSGISHKFFDEMPDTYKNNKRLKWIKRKAMKDWLFLPLYQYACNNKSIRYMVVKATYPKVSVDPAYLQETVKKTLTETWLLRYKTFKIPLRVVLNEYVKYDTLTRLSLSKMDIQVWQNFALFPSWKTFPSLNVTDYEFLLPLFDFDFHNEFNKGTIITKLYLCDRIELHPAEYVLDNLSIFFKVKNITLHIFDRIKNINEEYSVYICLEEFSSTATVSTGTTLGWLPFWLSILCML